MDAGDSGGVWVGGFQVFGLMTSLKRMSAVWAMRMLIVCVVLVPVSGLLQTMSADRLREMGRSEPSLEQPVSFVDHGKTYYVSTAANEAYRWTGRVQFAAVIAAVFFGVAAISLRGGTHGQRKW